MIGGFGAGADYYLINNVALGLSTKYIISRGHQFQLPGQPALTGNFDSLFMFLNVRVVFANI